MSLRHIRHLPTQLPVVAALGTALLRTRRAAATASPSSELIETIAPPNAALVRDYVEHVGGDRAAYRSSLPPHLFPQWSFPLAARTLAGVPYPVTRIINAGCRLEIRSPLPTDTPLVVRASLTSIDDDGRRALLTQRIVTGTRQTPDALVATITALIPLRSAKSESKSRASRPACVPYDAHELTRWSFARDAGLAFAVLTGDFNPIHWSTRAGIAAGFGGPILHGFAMLARAFEGVARTRFAGDVTRLRTIDARFTRPLRVPAEVGLYSRGDDVWIGDAPGTAPYLAMTMGERS